jgi:hypothetical protein
VIPVLREIEALRAIEAIRATKERRVIPGLRPHRFQILSDV